MATKEELEVQNAALREELEEEKRRSAMEQNVWNSTLPSPRENRERVQKRLGYEKAAVSALVGAQKDASSVAGAESSVDEDVAKELERLRKENEELRASGANQTVPAAPAKEEKKEEEKPAAKKTASSKSSFK